MDDDPPGPLIASGRAADVFDLGDGTVLRRYRYARSSNADDGPELEARVMRHVADHGIRVPRVDDAGGTDMVMERIDGITMLEAIGKRPWTILSMLRLLAKLQRQLAEVPAPDWLMPPHWNPGPTFDSVLHLDLHPMNVMITADQPVIIDWTNASGGPAGFDAALSYVVMVTAEGDGLDERIGKHVGARTFRRARGARLVDAFLGAACDHRLADRNLTPSEREAVAALRTRAR